MGECLLVRRGGGKATLKGISVKTPPANLEYLAGDTFDPTGMVLTVNVGGVPVDVTTGYTVTTDPLTADTTAVTISYTLDGKTATTTQAVTVKAYDPVFANNTWEKIIGKHKQLFYNNRANLNGDDVNEKYKERKSNF